MGNVHFASSTEHSPWTAHSIYQTLSRVKSSGDAAYLRTVARLIACKDANLFDTSSCPLTPPTTFYKPLEIERRRKLDVVFLLLY